MRAVIFDFYRTIASVEEGMPELVDICSGLDLTLDVELARKWSVEGADGGEHLEASRSRESYEEWERERYEQMLIEAGLSQTLAAATSGEVFTAVRKCRPVTSLSLYDDALSTVHTLKERDYKVGLCSNWSWDLESALTHLGVDNLFDVVTVSAQAGARKPHPRLFDETLAGLGCESADVLFVGDSVKADVVGALRAGMEVVLILREPLPEDILEGLNRSRNVTVCKELSEVLEVVK